MGVETSEQSVVGLVRNVCMDLMVRNLGFSDMSCLARLIRFHQILELFKLMQCVLPFL